MKKMFGKKITDRIDLQTEQLKKYELLLSVGKGVLTICIIVGGMFWKLSEVRQDILDKLNQNTTKHSVLVAERNVRWGEDDKIHYRLDEENKRQDTMLAVLNDRRNYFLTKNQKRKQNEQR